MVNYDELRVAPEISDILSGGVTYDSLSLENDDAMGEIVGVTYESLRLANHDELRVTQKMSDSLNKDEVSEAPEKLLGGESEDKCDISVAKPSLHSVEGGGTVLRLSLAEKPDTDEVKCDTKREDKSDMSVAKPSLNSVGGGGTVLRLSLEEKPSTVAPQR